MKFGIYEVEEEYYENGLWKGYKVGCVSSEGQKQGKLYPKTDGTEHYRAKPKDNELEI